VHFDDEYSLFESSLTSQPVLRVQLEAERKNVYLAFHLFTFRLCALLFFVSKLCVFIRSGFMFSILRTVVLVSWFY